jgi:AraC family transcriptional regulator
MGAGNPVVGSGEPQSRVCSLVRRAMDFLNRDRTEAWRCLQDVYSLLGKQSEAERLKDPVLQTGTRPGGLAAWQVRRSLAYIEEHLGAKLALEEIVAQIGLSRSHFSRAFKTSLGSSPMAYVILRRVERAKLMMMTSAAGLADVAQVCGFADQSHLTRQFRRIAGKCPSQWRRSSQHAPVSRQPGSPMRAARAPWQSAPASVPGADIRPRTTY